ncbi:MAG: iron-sulfur cluster assembly scaffold protein [Candidatus Lokiarchaeota archaeon]|nr:iron-sulfur cluster assembly scaffold protein [Candidatus Lokiarchaeota archaeon]
MKENEQVKNETVDSFDAFVNQLQQEIIENEIKEYNERIVELFQNPKNWGELPEEETSVSQKYLGPCGDTMNFYLKIRNNIIEKVKFITDGCGASVATGSQTTLLIEGKTLTDAKKLTPEDIDEALNGLPDDHKHCAELAVRTLRRAIDDYEKNIKS